jgi:hypothetical protein
MYFLPFLLMADAVLHRLEHMYKTEVELLCLVVGVRERVNEDERNILHVVSDREQTDTTFYQTGVAFADSTDDVFEMLTHAAKVLVKKRKESFVFCRWVATRFAHCTQQAVSVNSKKLYF